MTKALSTPENRSNQVTTIKFHDQELTTIEKDGEIFVALKPIVLGMGMDWYTQFRKIKDDTRYSHMTIPLKTSGGTQDMFCLPLKKLNGWLFGINPLKVKKEIREKVIMYQEECFEVLYDYWHKGAAFNHRPTLTPEQQRMVQKAVARKAGGKNRDSFIKVYSAIKDRFQVGTYKDIPSDQFDELMTFIGKNEPEIQMTPEDADLIVEGIFQCLDAITNDLERMRMMNHNFSVYAQKVVNALCILNPREFMEARKVGVIKTRETVK